MNIIGMKRKAETHDLKGRFNPHLIPPLEESCRLYKIQTLLTEFRVIPPIIKIITDYAGFADGVYIQKDFDPVTKTLPISQREEYLELSRFFRCYDVHGWREWAWHNPVPVAHFRFLMSQESRNFGFEVTSILSFSEPEDFFPMWGEKWEMVDQFSKVAVTAFRFDYYTHTSDFRQMEELVVGVVSRGWWPKGQWRPAQFVDFLREAFTFNDVMCHCLPFLVPSDKGKEFSRLLLLALPDRDWTKVDELEKRVLRLRLQGVNHPEARKLLALL
jgi:hypothetical protein